MAATDEEETRTRVLDTAEELFYAHGVQAVGMDRIRTASEVPLKRLYRIFPSKESLVAAYLERRDERWTASLRARVETAAAGDRVAAVFDWLADWFAEPDFRGCAFLNTYGELGEAAPEPVLAVIRGHKARLRDLLGEVAAAAGAAGLADRLLILVEGATVVAALTPGREPADQAREMALALLPHSGEPAVEPCV
ncbi:TetR/AcrR family transcriptional regulator [Streptomyces bambusae]|uniref:TetR/AcrR family transcriptional regulator n=1 Tax=Streptomyces bambusae TaxID=1550616 RepID=UPI001CFF704C|nr:TetR/AcrR family transcriptional regulator [Streptomyces bambusae]MCB5170078.1 TetR/AcrR family transcriptional regulator [Streptomyces bambusae]